ncbi:sensor histidine kinase [Actinoplanes derwentensis]|uniref:histidine kinase n=1 Tax=Actinoplanes derwentensis TaxID=113562 RepID=A0A1H1RVV0_9ACTN|nr:histidine kinase [Actinoplanes derwentensis]GID84536.1 two-component sensor histidine kinase [Actinoplanes derwentensis]SDS39860.1 Signal transduction histidine kinase [Actinoplanes derwentensis]
MPIGRLRVPRDQWGTSIIVVLCLIVGLYSNLVRWGPSNAEWLQLGLNTAVALSLIWRRTHPWWVLAVVVAGDTLSEDTQMLAMAVVTYSLAVYRPLATAIIGVVAALTVIGFEAHHRDSEYGVESFASFYLILTVVPLLVGANVAARRRYVGELVDRAARLAREKEQEGELAAARERARIAHDMHDIVAHNLTIMVRLADGALAVADSDPQRSRRAVERSANLGREAMKDMRRLLGVLRDGSTDTPGDLESLVETFRIAGLPVILRRRGTDSISPGLRLVVFRSVQESLTNALRYAENPTEVLVDVDYTADPIRVEVTDDGRGTVPAPSIGSEQGLKALRERAALYHGSVESGPRHPGWSVRVSLPNPAEGTDE